MSPDHFMAELAAMLVPQAQHIAEQLLGVRPSVLNGTAAYFLTLSSFSASCGSTSEADVRQVL